MVGTSYMGHDYVRTILSLYTLFTAFSTFYVLPPRKQSVEKVWVNSLLFVVVGFFFFPLFIFTTVRVDGVRASSQAPALVPVQSHMQTNRYTVKSYE